MKRKPIQEITIFETSDGQRFETRADAEIHNMGHEIVKLAVDGVFTHAVAKDIPQFLRINAPAVIAYIQIVQRYEADKDKKKAA